MTTATIEARMPHPVMVLPDAMKALLRLSKAANEAGLPAETVFLVHLRASQINGCSVCVEMHSRELKQAGASDERVYAVAAWREAPYFTDPERAALALAEAATRVADRPDAIADDVWDEAARHYDETELAALIIEIGAINVWNRLNLATRQPAGSFAA
jgi:AhpD family alkylhydroperoxidase